jgi:hypothetical protein
MLSFARSLRLSSLHIYMESVANNDVLDSRHDVVIEIQHKYLN